MLNVEKINQYYGESHTLWDLSLSIPEGKCTVLMGRNGVVKPRLSNASWDCGTSYPAACNTENWT